MGSRHLIFGSLLALVCAPASAQTASATEKAYHMAIRCFVANGRQDEAGAKAAYDAALRLASVLQLSNKQINFDFADTTSKENIAFARTPAYRERVVSECRQVGMAS